MYDLYEGHSISYGLSFHNFITSISFTCRVSNKFGVKWTLKFPQQRT